MASRLFLQNELEVLLGTGNVYFQPPASVHMQYPAIVYSLSDMEPKRADDGIYTLPKRYNVTVIDKNPDSVLPDKMIALPLCSFDRFYTSDNLNHWTFSLYY